MISTFVPVMVRRGTYVECGVFKAEVSDHVLQVTPLEPFDSCLIDHHSLLFHQINALRSCFLISLVCHHQIVAEHHAEVTHSDWPASIELLEGHANDRVVLFGLAGKKELVECYASVLKNTRGYVGIYLTVPSLLALSVIVSIIIGSSASKRF